tara:strand:- start:9181 stop:9432 length:252 start_codon:yes stop_codon:yes gene_type:complete
MLIKLQVVIFAQSRNLSEEILKNITKLRKSKSRFNSIKKKKKLKEVKNYNEIINKTLAFYYPPYELAYKKNRNTKVFLKTRLN